MPTRKATAQWNGPLNGGSGELSFGDHNLSYSAPSRFADGDGTNPEELIAAAHAGCYAMALSHALGEAGFEVRQLDASASVRIQQKDGGFVIDKIDLRMKGDVAEIDEAQFLEFANKAKENCPVTRALAGVAEITLDAEFVG